MSCVLILYIKGGTYNLKSTPNSSFFEKRARISMAVLLEGHSGLNYPQSFKSQCKEISGSTVKTTSLSQISLFLSSFVSSYNAISCSLSASLAHSLINLFKQHDNFLIKRFQLFTHKKKEKKKL